MVEIAWLPNVELSSYPSWDGFGNESGFRELMPDGWTRLESNDIVDTVASISFATLDHTLWLSQANHIFSTLQISSNFQDYVLVHHLEFMLSILTVTFEQAMPTGFLFLCPPEDFQIGNASFKWPDCPAYWSLDPSGAERLTLEEATGLGFPSFQLSTEAEGSSWDADVYAGLCRFHKAKGFDPDSQDLAQHLDHPMYQSSGPFAHINDDEFVDNTHNGDDPHRKYTDEGFHNAPDEDALESPPSDDLDLAVHHAVDEVPLSSEFKLVMNVQLSLILLLALFEILYAG
ncbi:hypothetical protein C8R45DRAFT_525560 [Mycena sanguinolenta]|nr:hypothetical protein C8R45DRAFT_525560 [Mycena sanguinolenta]